MLFLSKKNKNIICYIGSDLLAKAIPFLLIPLVTKYLTPYEYGNVALFNIILEVMTIIVVLGTNSYYKIEYFNRDNAIVLFSSLIVTIFISFFAVFSVSIIACFFKEKLPPLTGWLPFISVVALLQSLYYLFLSYYQCTENALKVGSANLIFSFFSAVGMVVLIVFFHLNEEARYYSVLISVLITVSFLFLSFNRVNKIKFSKKISYDSFRFGFGIFPHALSWWARSGLDRLLVSYFLSVSILGVYSLALQCLSLLMIVCNAINQSFIPSIMQELKNNNKKNVKKMLLLLSLAMLGICVFAAITIPYLFYYFIDSRYISAIAYLPYMCIIFSLQALVIFYSNILYFYKKVRFLSLITFSTSLLYLLVLYILLINDFGLFSVLYSSVATYLLAAMCILNKSYKLLNS